MALADRLIRKVSGPTLKKGDNEHPDRYQIKIQYGDGKAPSHSSRAFDSTFLAEREKTRLLKISAEQKGGEADGRQLDEWDGTLQWVEALLSRMMREVYLNPRDQDLRAALKSIASAATSVKNLHDTTDLEERLIKAEGVLGEIMSARKHGTGTQGEIEHR